MIDPIEAYFTEKLFGLRWSNYSLRQWILMVLSSIIFQLFDKKLRIKKIQKYGPELEKKRAKDT